MKKVSKYIVLCIILLTISASNFAHAAMPSTASGNFSFLYDVSVPAQGLYRDIELFNDHLFISNTIKGVGIVPIGSSIISKVSSSIAFIDTPGEARDVVYDGDYIYVADGNAGLTIIRAYKNSSGIIYKGSVVRTIQLPGYSNTITKSGQTIIVGNSSEGVSFLNISNSTTPQISNIDLPGMVMDIELLEPSCTVSSTCTNTKYLVAANLYGVVTIDFSNLNALNIISTAGSNGEAQDIAVKKDTVYLADGFNGITIYDFSDPRSPYVSSSLYLEEVSTGVAIDATSNTLYVSSHVVIAKNGPEDPGIPGLYALDVSDAIHPEVISTYQGSDTNLDVEYYNGRVYTYDKSGFKVKVLKYLR